MAIEHINDAYGNLILIKKMTRLILTIQFIYYFQGGDGYQHVASNNPLYITDHRDGGYGSKTDYEKERETIYAGVQHGSPTGVGPLCEFVSADGADKAEQSTTFEVITITLDNILHFSRKHQKSVSSRSNSP
jgi:hypothetical protein